MAVAVGTGVTATEEARSKLMAVCCAAGSGLPASAAFVFSGALKEGAPRCHAATLSSSPRMTIFSAYRVADAEALSFHPTLPASRPRALQRSAGSLASPLVDRRDDGIRRRRQEAVDLVRGGDGLRLGSAVTAEGGPDHLTRDVGARLGPGAIISRGKSVVISLASRFKGALKIF
jgi:hypothetical protein